MMPVVTGSGAVWLERPLVTGRLWLRMVTEEDSAFLVRLWTDPEVQRYLGGPRPAGALRQAARHRVAARGMFVVTMVDGTPLGTVRLHPYARTGETEVSYTFLPEHWGRGYAREAVGAVLGWGFRDDRVLPRIIAVTQEANGRSRRLLEALGMRLVDRYEEFGAPQTVYSVDRGKVRPVAVPVPGRAAGRAAGRRAAGH
jgi:RimJ/RimL family protein N-acetyltransferase